MGSYRMRHLLTLLAASLFTTTSVNANNGFYRHPTLNQQSLVFSSEGDLWKTSSTGGQAMRLTTHSAEEVSPLMSNDGKWLAFTANYNGGMEIYVMPSSGGVPKQITFDNGRALPQTWTTDNKLIYSAPIQQGPLRSESLYQVDPVTLKRDAIPLADANQATLAGDGKTLFFVRGGVHLTNDNARYYRGGNKASVWRWQLGSSSEAVQVSPEQDRSFRAPMFWQNQLYLLSEDNGVDNLWRMNLDGSNLIKLTNHSDFEVRGPSLHDGRIVYQHGADLRVFDLASGSDQKLNIDLVSDFEQTRTRWIGNPLEFLQHLAIAGDGSRVALTARGKPMVAGTTALRRMPMQIPDDVIASATQLSPDGKYLYAITDQSGEEEIWRYPVNSTEKPQQLTKDKIGQRFNLHLSPNGEWLAHDDKQGNLWLLNTKTLKNEKLDNAIAVGSTEFQDLSWSADSRFIAYSRPDNMRGVNQIVLRDIAGGKSAVVTTEKYPSFSPTFSADGQWLYFLSNRHYKPTPSSPWGDRNMGPHFDKRTEVFALALTSDAKFPFAPDTELGVKQPEKKDDDKKDKKKTEEKPGTTIAWNGLADRIYQAPVSADNYRKLELASDRLFLLEAGENGNKGHAIKTMAFSNDAPKLETFFDGAHDFGLSADRKKLWLSKTANNKISAVYLMDAGAKASSELDKVQVQTGGWKLAIEPREEWRQMFHDAWRMQRDFLFDPKLRGIDWQQTKTRYEPLLARVNSRQELDDLIAQMIAELGVLHSQMRSGDNRRDNEQPQQANLGAVLDAEENGYRINHIYRGDRDLLGERSPLDLPGVDVQEGDLITHVNHQPVRLGQPIEVALRQQVGQQVRLDIQREKNSHTVIVKPVEGFKQSLLKYADWERRSLENVQQKSNGKIGYLHLRAMGPNDIASFARDFYAQYDKEALIIDVRRNNGGNIDSWIIQQFLRQTWAFWAPDQAPAFWNMQQTFRGHVAFLIDEYTYSDGETFAAGVKALELGPLIGKRTSGAGVWLSDRNRLVDGGMARAAEFAQYRADGEWIIEGYGVTPDVEVDNLPYATFNGNDAQLQSAIEYLQKKLQAEPITRPQPKPIAPLGQPGKDVEPLKR